MLYLRIPDDQFDAVVFDYIRNPGIESVEANMVYAIASKKIE